jgi:hypothetical protein
VKRDYVGEALGEGSAKKVAQLKPKPSWRDHVLTAPDLCDQKFPEPKQIIPGLFSEGVNLLVSRPKLGKSWLLQQIGAAVANGVSVLISTDQPAHGDVLYLNLEDGFRRAQRRLTKYFGGLRDNWPKRLEIARDWRRLDQGGPVDLREWCRSMAKPTLICIDTLKRVRPPKKGNQSDYDADYEACQGLLQLTHEFPGLAVIVAHHDRKMDAEDIFDTVSGTLGLTGGVDAIALLKRSAQGISLHVEGRDLEDTVEKAMLFDRETCRWQVIGNAADVHRSAERTRVLDALANGPLTVSEIKSAADLKSRDAADKLCQRMTANGDIDRLDRGRYGLPMGMVSEVSERGGKPHGNPQKTGTSESDTTSDTLLRGVSDVRKGRLGAPAISSGPDDDLADFAGGL